MKHFSKLLSHKKERNCAICRDVNDLETVIQSKLSQTEKDTHNNHLDVESKKNGTDEPVCKAERHRRREQRYGHQEGGGGWDELGDWD